MIEGPPKVVGSKPSAAAEFVNARTSPSQKENQAPSQRDPHPSPRTVYWVEPSQRSLYSFQPCDTERSRSRSWSLDASTVERRYDSPTFERHHVYHRHQPNPPLLPTQQLMHCKEPVSAARYSYVERRPRSAFSAHRRYEEHVTTTSYEHVTEAPWEPPVSRGYFLKRKEQLQEPKPEERIVNKEQAAVDAILSLKRSSPMGSPQRRVVIAKPIPHRRVRYAYPHRRQELHSYPSYDSHSREVHASEHRRPGFYLTMRFH